MKWEFSLEGKLPSAHTCKRAAHGVAGDGKTNGIGSGCKVEDTAKARRTAKEGAAEEQVSENIILIKFIVLLFKCSRSEWKNSSKREWQVATHTQRDEIDNTM